MFFNALTEAMAGDVFELRIDGLGGRESGGLAEVIAGVMVEVEQIL
jgi:hypothetical protein